MSIKPIQLDDSTICFSVFDTAIDLEKSNIEKYNKEWLKNPSCWRDYLVLKDGERLTEFVIGVVPTSEFIRIMEECKTSESGTSHDQEFWWRCFINGVRKINNWNGEQPKTKMINNIEYVDPQWLSNTFIRGLRKIALDIGMHVVAFNSTTDEEIKNLSTL